MEKEKHDVGFFTGTWSGQKQEELTPEKFEEMRKLLKNHKPPKALVLLPSMAGFDMFEIDADYAKRLIIGNDLRKSLNLPIRFCK